MKKSINALVLGFLALGVLTACGGNSGQSSSSSADVSSSVPGVSSEVPATTSETEPVVTSEEAPVVESSEGVFISSSEETPIATSELPVGTSELPVGTSELPVGTSELPVETSELPVGTSEEEHDESHYEPVDTSELPVETSELIPVEESELPIESSELIPVEESELPIESSEELPPESSEVSEESSEEDLSGLEAALMGLAGMNFTMPYTGGEVYLIDNAAVIFHEEEGVDEEEGTLIPESWEGYIAGLEGIFNITLVGEEIEFGEIVTANPTIPMTYFSADAAIALNILYGYVPSMWTHDLGTRYSLKADAEGAAELLDSFGSLIFGDYYQLYQVYYGLTIDGASIIAARNGDVTFNLVYSTEGYDGRTTSSIPVKFTNVGKTVVPGVNEFLANPTPAPVHTDWTEGQLSLLNIIFEDELEAFPFINAQGTAGAAVTDYYLEDYGCIVATDLLAGPEVFESYIPSLEYFGFVPVDDELESEDIEGDSELVESEEDDGTIELSWSGVYENPVTHTSVSADLFYLYDPANVLYPYGILELDLYNVSLKAANISEILAEYYFPALDFSFDRYTEAYYADYTEEASAAMPGYKYYAEVGAIYETPEEALAVANAYEEALLDDYFSPVNGNGGYNEEPAGKLNPRRLDDSEEEASEWSKIDDAMKVLGFNGYAPELPSATSVWVYEDFLDMGVVFAEIETENYYTAEAEYMEILEKAGYELHEDDGEIYYVLEGANYCITFYTYDETFYFVVLPYEAEEASEVSSETSLFYSAQYVAYSTFYDTTFIVNIVVSDTALYMTFIVYESDMTTENMNRFLGDYAWLGFHQLPAAFAEPTEVFASDATDYADLYLPDLGQLGAFMYYYFDMYYDSLDEATAAAELLVADYAADENFTRLEEEEEEELFELAGADQSEDIDESDIWEEEEEGEVVTVYEAFVTDVFDFGSPYYDGASYVEIIAGRDYWGDIYVEFSISFLAYEKLAD